MSGRSRHLPEEVRNKAQEERQAADEDVKKLTDLPDIQGGERWDHPVGHSGTRHAWLVSVAMVACFLLAAGGFTFGPRVLLWIGVGLFAALGIYSLASRAWTDYVHHTGQGPDDIRDQE